MTLTGSTNSDWQLKTLLISQSSMVANSVRVLLVVVIGDSTLVPEVFLDFSPHERAAKRRTRVAKRRTRVAKRRVRKTSGYLGLESHFHADANCQTRQIDNYKGHQ